jgi:hypothetical protein
MSSRALFRKMGGLSQKMVRGGNLRAEGRRRLVEGGTRSRIYCDVQQKFTVSCGRRGHMGGECHSRSKALIIHIQIFISPKSKTRKDASRGFEFSGLSKKGNKKIAIGYLITL